MASTGWAPPLTVTAEAVGDSTVLNARGVLDDSTYLALRDQVIGAALEEPDSVIVDVTELDVPSESAWLALTSASRHVDRWPEVPISLVCRHAAGRNAIVRSGVVRFLPVHSTIQSAIEASSRTHRDRRRAWADLPATVSSLKSSRDLVAEWLTAWSRAELIPVTNIVVTTLVENVLQHTDSRPRVRLETDGAAVTVAVEDSSHTPAGLREATIAMRAPSGLRIVAAMCRMWGNAPTPRGKTVWAVIGPENRL
ncbi:MAG: STAS domain-containing protein [Mycobacterium sp.]